MRKRFLFILVAFTVVMSTTASIQPAAAADGEKPVVYLTFDDGPHRTRTDLFLDLLAQYDAKGTFFVTGNIGKNGDQGRRIVAEGHAIANHTSNHSRLTSLSDEQVREVFFYASLGILHETGVDDTCYRPPYGLNNERVHALAVEAGLTNSEWTANFPSGHMGGWDIDTLDWRGNANVVRNQLNKIKGGEVVLMHDTGLTALAPLKTWMANNHDKYEFKPLPGCGGEVYEPELDSESPESWYRFQVGRLYVAYFNRYPDSEGWAYWNDELVNGLSIMKISDFFASSEEFKITYGDALTNREFVRLVYLNVLDREPDETGWDYWEGLLDTGLTQGELMLYFSESEEFVRVAAPLLTGSCWFNDIRMAYACAVPSTPVWEP